MKQQWYDQDGNKVPQPLDDVTASLVAHRTLLDGSGGKLANDSAPVYLEFDLGDGKTCKVLNVGAKSND
jgi:hypothetical protein